MSEDIKLCIDCKHYSRDHPVDNLLFVTVDWCSSTPSLIDGKAIAVLCSSSRLAEDVVQTHDPSSGQDITLRPCGPQGRFWVKKED